VSRRDSNLEIYVMNADGSEQRRLTRNPANEAWFAWSPDGRKIAFDGQRGGYSDVYVMNADGSGQRLLTQRGAQPRWSPDGRKIAFRSSREGTSEIYVMSADGSDQRRLTRTADDGARVTYHVAWSPGRKK
jgi:Tol biopolymer transport system component